MRAVTDAFLASPARAVTPRDVELCGQAQRAERARFNGILAAGGWDRDEFWAALRETARKARDQK